MDILMRGWKAVTAPILQTRTLCLREVRCLPEVTSWYMTEQSGHSHLIRGPRLLPAGRAGDKWITHSTHHSLCLPLSLSPDPDQQLEKLIPSTSLFKQDLSEGLEASPR